MRFPFFFRPTLQYCGTYDLTSFSMFLLRRGFTLDSGRLLRFSAEARRNCCKSLVDYRAQVKIKGNRPADVGSPIPGALPVRVFGQCGNVLWSGITRPFLLAPPSCPRPTSANLLFACEKIIGNAIYRLVFFYFSHGLSNIFGLLGPRSLIFIYL